MIVLGWFSLKIRAPSTARVARAIGQDIFEGGFCGGWLHHLSPRESAAPSCAGGAQMRQTIPDPASAAGSALFRIRDKVGLQNDARYIVLGGRYP